MVVLACPAAAADRAELRVADAPEIQRQTFRLDAESELRISSHGWSPQDRDEGGNFLEQLFHRDGDRSAVEAWILESSSRRTVWEFPGRDPELAGEGHQRRRVDVLALGPGDYELYLHTQLPSDAKERRERRAEMQDCGVLVEFERDVRLLDERFEFDHTLLRLAPLGDDEFHEQAFRLDREVRLRVYALGEHSHGSRSSFDGAWIEDLATGERVLDLSALHGASAGGVSRNRRIDQPLALPAGDYLVVAGTDDSHSYDGFHGSAPHDPEFWGITLVAADAASSSHFRTIERPSDRAPDLAMTAVGNGELRRAAFRLDAPTRLRLRVMGEANSSGWAFVDQGWILDLDTRELVWAMDDRLCRSAGGFERNLVFDGEIGLPAGRYLALYATDGGHAFGDFFSVAPFRPEDWGLQIWDLSEDGHMQVLDEVPAGAWLESALLAVVGVGDDEDRVVPFELERETALRVTVTGEARGDDVFDSAYLRGADSRRVVFEPDWNSAEWAGGAERNQRVSAALTLPAGRYEVVVETDGSHSSAGWSGAAPWDPDAWGIVIRRAETF